ncbi:hypothetical protein KW786_03540, partial [Candidatus Parcubacteria bacterium]|nr:hypothetical protein [Candidatus Parcubacteria bacterium]
EGSDKDTAYISDAAIMPAYQHVGLIGPMMRELEAELVKKGYRFFEIDAADIKYGEKGESYADKIRKNYPKRIISEEAHDSPAFGPQVFFRIELPKPEEKPEG